jgi:hypothetical protein
MWIFQLPTLKLNLAYARSALRSFSNNMKTYPNRDETVTHTPVELYLPIMSPRSIICSSTRANSYQSFDGGRKVLQHKKIFTSCRKTQ